MSGRGLRVESLTVRFGGTAAVDDLTLSVGGGEVLALLGPSGCGKSTLLRAVAGIVGADTGTVAWSGTDLTGVPVHRRGFGLMFQEGQLFPHRDVGSNVAFGLRMARIGKDRRARRTAELLELVGLAGYERRAVATLSGGEQQRVALARSLAPGPRLLLLDEPLSSLDRSLRERLAADLREILTTTGTTALCVTHDHDEAFTVADRVGVMAAGSLRQVGAPHQVWQHPADEFVARFLGYRQVIDARLLGAGLGLAGSRSARVALRPESFALDPGGALTGRVVDCRVARSGTTLWVELEGLGVVEARLPGVIIGPGQVPTGGTVRLRVVPQAVAVLP